MFPLKLTTYQPSNVFQNFLSSFSILVHIPEGYFQSFFSLTFLLSFLSPPLPLGFPSPHLFFLLFLLLLHLSPLLFFSSFILSSLFSSSSFFYHLLNRPSLSSIFTIIPLSIISNVPLLLYTSSLSAICLILLFFLKSLSYSISSHT